MVLVRPLGHLPCYFYWSCLFELWFLCFFVSNVLFTAVPANILFPDRIQQEGGSAVRSLDNVRRFWLCIRGRKKFVPSFHAGVPGSNRGSHRRGRGQAEGTSAEKRARRGMNAASCAHRTHTHTHTRITLSVVAYKTDLTFSSRLNSTSINNLSCAY